MKGICRRKKRQLNKFVLPKSKDKEKGYPSRSKYIKNNQRALICESREMVAIWTGSMTRGTGRGGYENTRQRGSKIIREKGSGGNNKKFKGKPDNTRNIEKRAKR